MRDVTAKSGVISKEIKWIFQRVRRSLMKIRNKRAQNTAVRCSSLDMERRRKGSI